jgi:RimJ/RimL family protein N-acetyltransferase
VNLPKKVVGLRDMREEDIHVFFEHQRDPAANELAAFPARDRDGHMAHWIKIMADPTVVTKTIEMDGEVVGNVVSWVKDGRRAIGYWVGQAYWGKGVATNAVRQFLNQVSERPLYAWVATHNIGSIRVLEKCGFVRTGERLSGDDKVEEIVLELRG